MWKEGDGEVVAIAVADIHLSMRAPLYRSNESDWYEAMSVPLKQLQRLQHKHNCPILCAGDLFENWNSPPEVINFALENLPERMYCIPGQHDLPNHSLSDLDRSAYATLMRAGKITDLSSETMHLPPNLEVTGFAFGQQVQKPRKKDEGDFQIALMHAFRWCKKRIPGVTYKNIHIDVFTDLYSQWDLVVCGDNHSRFYLPDAHFLNCGGLMIRHLHEADHQPKISLIKCVDNKLKVVGIKVNTSKDRYLDAEQLPKEGLSNLDVGQLVQALQQLESDEFDFVAAINAYCDRTKQRKAIIQMLHDCLEEDR